MKDRMDTDRSDCRWCEWLAACLLLGIALVLGVLLRDAAGTALEQFHTGRTGLGIIGGAVCLFIGLFAGACLAYSYILARWGFIGPWGQH